MVAVDAGDRDWVGTFLQDPRACQIQHVKRLVAVLQHRHAALIKDEFACRREAARTKYDGKYANKALFATMRTPPAPSLRFLCNAQGEVRGNPVQVERIFREAWQTVYQAPPQGSEAQSRCSFVTMATFTRTYPC